MITFIIILIITNFAFASEAYTPPKESPKRKAILSALREELKQFQDDEPSGVKWFIEEGKKVSFIVNYLKVKDNWAWLEAKGKNYLIDINSLLHKKEGRWVVQGLVQPSYVECLNEEECVDLQAYIYKKFMEKFPQVPPDIFPKIDPERRPILNSLKKYIAELNFIFVVRHLKVKNRWAWIEIDPRGFEPIDALLHKQKGQWVIKHFRPCCGEWDDFIKQNNIKSMEGYYRHLIQMFPGVTRELFPK